MILPCNYAPRGVPHMAVGQSENALSLMRGVPANPDSHICTCGVCVYDTFFVFLKLEPPEMTVKLHFLHGWVISILHGRGSCELMQTIALDIVS